MENFWNFNSGHIMRLSWRKLPIRFRTKITLFCAFSAQNTISNRRIQEFHVFPLHPEFQKRRRMVLFSILGGLCPSPFATTMNLSKVCHVCNFNFFIVILFWEKSERERCIRRIKIYFRNRAVIFRVKNHRKILQIRYIFPLTFFNAAESVKKLGI